MPKTLFPHRDPRLTTSHHPHSSDKQLSTSLLDPLSLLLNTVLHTPEQGPRTEAKTKNKGGKMTIQTVQIPHHLNGTTAAYQTPHPLDSTKPTVVLVNSFTTSSELYRAQFSDPSLTSKLNLLAIEPLGHGSTRTSRSHWTYWDTAEMNLHVLDALGIDQAFVLGTSQGGWITVMMALMRPDKILGVMPLGSSMDSESERSRALGCWDGAALLTPFVEKWTPSTTTGTAEFEPEDTYCDALIAAGLNDCDDGVRQFWRNAIKANYRGDDGRQRIHMAAINLVERSGLHLRLADVKCPVLWLHVCPFPSLPSPALAMDACMLISTTGDGGRGIQRGQCQRRGREVPKCPLGDCRGGCAFPELLESRGCE